MRGQGLVGDSGGSFSSGGERDAVCAGPDLWEQPFLLPRRLEVCQPVGGLHAQSEGSEHVHREGENAPITPVQSAKKTSRVGTSGGGGRGRHGGRIGRFSMVFAARPRRAAGKKIEDKNGGVLRWGF